jgi:hypothetical protein
MSPARTAGEALSTRHAADDESPIRVAPLSAASLSTRVISATAYAIERGTASVIVPLSEGT